MILWEFLGFGWMTWVCLVMFCAVVPRVCWLGRRLRRRTLLEVPLPAQRRPHPRRDLLVELVLNELTKHLVNPTPMLGGVLIAIGRSCSSSRVPRAAGSASGRPGRPHDRRRTSWLVLLVLSSTASSASRSRRSSGHAASTSRRPARCSSPTRGTTGSSSSGRTATARRSASGLLTARRRRRRRRPARATSTSPTQATTASCGSDGYYSYTVGSHTFNLALADGAGDQTSLGTGLKDPQSVSVDGLGDLFVADTGNNRIVEISRKTCAQTHVPHGARAGRSRCLADPFYTEDGVRREHRRGHRRRGAAERQAHGPALGASTSPRASPRTPGATCTSRRWATGRSSRSPTTATGNASVIRTGLGHPRGLSVDALGNLFISDTNAGQVKVVASLREHQLLTHGMPDPSAVALRAVGRGLRRRRVGRAGSRSGTTARCAPSRPGSRDPVGVAAGPNGDVWVVTARGRALARLPGRRRLHRVVALGVTAGARQLYAVPGASGDVLVAEEVRTASSR